MLDIYDIIGLKIRRCAVTEKLIFLNVVTFVKLTDQKFMRYFYKYAPLGGRDFPRTLPVRPWGHQTSYTGVLISP
jgi:hypothetical protein